ncbi:MAG TPA: peptidase [Sphingomonas bacterium]|jgi:uncharacterized iron-regulated membrane protein|uniref:Peptidase n=1 Tax=Sphingomonas bacterium TaxID=1895847 RepID=A0A3D0WCM7_9SPHN|nr:peptidase [Sphingomonas bacterium]
MRFPSADLVRRALSGHAAIGLLAGGLLYLICLSGTIVVLREEIQRWEQPNVAEASMMTPAALQTAARNVLASEAGRKPTEHFYIRLPNGALPRAVVTTDNQAVYVDGTGAIADKEAHGWTEFLINLHVYLHVPGTLGLTIVGALGVMMTALTLGGVLAHPRIFRDAFRLRARGQTQLALADWHNRLGVWTLPFGLALALTGAMIGLAGVGFWAVANQWYGGDVEKAYAPIFGGEPAHAEGKAPLARIDRAMANLTAAHPGVEPSYVILHEPGTRGQYLTILAKHPRRLIYGETYAFDASGRPTHKVGLSDGPIGQQFAASTYDLHFGAFGGWPVRVVYVLLGAAVTVICGTGMSIWLVKRRQRGRASPRLEAMWAATLWGAPLLLMVALAARAVIGPEAPMVALFWIGLALLIAAGILAPRAEAWARSLRLVLGLSMAAAGAIHLAMMENAIVPLYLLDAALLMGGAWFLWPALRRVRVARSPEMAPAE